MGDRIIRREQILIFIINLICCFSFSVADEVRLIKLFEIGSEKAKEEMFFRPHQVKTNRKGHIYVLDGGENCIFKFSEKGQYIKKAGRKGQGPGEMDNPMGFDIDDEGRLWVNDAFNRRIIVYDHDLLFIKTVSIDKFYVRLFNIGKTLLLLSRPAVRGENYLDILSTEGKLLRSFQDNFHPLAPDPKSDVITKRLTSIYFFGVADINPERMIVAFAHMIPENPMKIFLMNLKGEIQKIIVKQIDSYNEQEQYNFIRSTVKPAKTIVTREIVGVHFTPENNLLVQKRDSYSKEGIGDKTIYNLSLFSTKGDCLAEDIHCDGKILHIDRNGRIYMLIESESGFYLIAVYSLNQRH